VNWNVVPGLVPVMTEFQLPVMVVCSGKTKLSVQVLGVVVPLLVTDTSN
jgi:hypothetical protein